MLTTAAALKSLYDAAFTAVNPSNVRHGYGNRFAQHYDVPWTILQDVQNVHPEHYPDCTSIAGLPHGVYPIEPAAEPVNYPILAVDDAPMPRMLDPETSRYMNMPSNPNALQPVRGGVLSDDTA